MAPPKRAQGNERLRGAMIAAHLDVDRLAEKTSVDPKTVQRWLSGRVPQGRLRWSAAEALGEDESYLWPSVAGLSATGGSTAEIVAAFPNRIDFPLAAWRELFSSARREIDLLGFALLFLPEQQSGLITSLAAKAAKSCQVRICLANPTASVVGERDQEEGLGGALAGRIQTGWTYFAPLMGLSGIQFRGHDTPMYNSIFRFDGQMLVTPHLHAAPGYSSPLLRLRRLQSGGVFDRFAAHFDSVWDKGKPIDALDDLIPDRRRGRPR